MIQRDPRVSLSVFEVTNPDISAEIRDGADIFPDVDEHLPYEPSHKRPRRRPPVERDDEVPVIIRVVPEWIVHFVA